MILLDILLQVQIARKKDATSDNYKFTKIIVLKIIKNQSIFSFPLSVEELTAINSYYYSGSILLNDSYI